jgi:hypothetical protein
MTAVPTRARTHRRRRLAWGLLALGLVLVVIAAVLATAVRAHLQTYPGDAGDTTMQATGTASLLVDPATLVPVTSVARTFPLTITRRMHTVGTSDDTAVVQEDVQEAITNLASLRYVQRYTVNRSTTENVADPQAFAYVPGDVVDRSPAYSVSFPFDAGRTSVPLWDDRIGQAHPLHYAGAANVSGLAVNRYQGSFDATALQPQFVTELVAAGLPSSLTFPQLTRQLAARGFDLDQLRRAVTALNGDDQAAAGDLLSRPIPLTYQLAANMQLDVEPRTGTIVSVGQADETISQRPDFTGLGRLYAILTQPTEVGKRDVATAVDTLARLSDQRPMIPVLGMTYAQTSQSTATVAAAARRWSDRIVVWTVIVPSVLGGIGVLLAVGSVVLLSRSRRHRRGQTSPSV